MVFALAALAAASACDPPLAPAPSTLPTVGRVVLVSVDGLRSDAAMRMPALTELRGRGLWTDSMRTVLPALTVPGHLSMFAGRDVTTLGIRDNSLDTAAVVGWYVNGVSTVFDWVRGAGGRSVAIAGASLVPENLRADAERFFGVDTLIATELEADAVAGRALEELGRPDAPMLLFVHFSDADLAGHDDGWVVPDARAADGSDILGTAYVEATLRVDAAIARLAAALAPAIDSGVVALVVTSDHGGGAGEGCTADVPAWREHCTSALADELVPFVLVARGAARGRMAAAGRLTQVGPTIGALLGAWTPRGVDRPIE
jgi:predicted AlkP superfamily pyrophosphatase or phosphodiesterase